MNVYEAVERAVLANKGPESFICGYTRCWTEHMEHMDAFGAHARYVALESIANILGLKVEYLWAQYHAQAHAAKEGL